MHLDAADFAAMDDSQRVAVLEAMVVGMLADAKITRSEVRRFDEIALGLPWGVEHDTLIAMVKAARDRIAELKTRDQIHDYVAKLAVRLPSPALREKVVFTMATLMLADGELAHVEKNVLGLIVVAFGITTERAAAIREALHLPPS
jgi:uncharacterized tellurite resistance protein B-like protein